MKATIRPIAIRRPEGGQLAVDHSPPPEFLPEDICGAGLAGGPIFQKIGPLFCEAGFRLLRS
jgi:hypothetical protein